MADIQIVQEHKLSPERARAAAQQVADKVAAKVAGKTGLSANPQTLR